MFCVATHFCVVVFFFVCHSQMYSFIYMLRSLVALFVLSLCARLSPKSCEWQFYRIKPKKKLKIIPSLIFWVENLRFCCHRAENIYFVVLFNFFPACICPMCSHLLETACKTISLFSDLHDVSSNPYYSRYTRTHRQSIALHTRILKPDNKPNTMRAHTHAHNVIRGYDDHRTYTGKNHLLVLATTTIAQRQPWFFIWLQIALKWLFQPFAGRPASVQHCQWCVMTIIWRWWWRWWDNTESSESSMMPRSNTHICGPGPVLYPSHHFASLFYFILFFIYFIFCPVKSSMTNRFKMCFLLAYRHKHNKCCADGWMDGYF